MSQQKSYSNELSPKKIKLELEIHHIGNGVSMEMEKKSTKTPQKLDLYANRLNGNYLLSVLPPDDLEIDGVLAAIAYGSDSTTLLENCLQSRRRLDIWMRYDHTVPVKPALLRKLLANTSKNIFCYLIPDVLHAKVIWWRNYGAYIGSANLTDRAWHGNIELGIFLPQAEMDDSGVTEQLEYFFDELSNCDAAFPLSEETILEQEALVKLRSAKVKELEELSRNNRSVNFWGGPVEVVKKTAHNRRKESFLKEWYEGVNALRFIAEKTSEYRPDWLKDDVPDVWHADQFLHAYYYNQVRDGAAYPYEELHVQNKKDPAEALAKALLWWKKLPEPPSGEDYNCHHRAPIIRELLSKERLQNLTVSDFQQICKANHSTVDHVRRIPLKKLGLLAADMPSEEARVDAFALHIWSEKNQRDESISEILRYVLDGGSADLLPVRLYESARTEDRRISHIGINQLAEMAGWARPELTPPRNGRTSKGLRALGYNVKVYS